MTILQVEKLPFDLEEYKKKPFHEKVKMACQAYVLQGFGAPISIPLYHAAKMGLFIWIWLLFCEYSTALGPMETILTWWYHPEAFAKFIAWWMLFENLGLGCASGPGMLRFVPPHPLAFQYLIPGMLKRPIPAVAKIPIIGGDKRTIVDNLLYAAHIFFLFRACYAPELAGNLELILPTIILLPIMGIMDKMIFLNARGEITYTAYFCFLFIDPATIGTITAGSANGNVVSALKVIWIGIWFYAASSKINRHFAGVVCGMFCNNPFFIHLPFFKGFKKRLFKKYPDNLQPGIFVKTIAHSAIVIELGIPFLLTWGSDISNALGLQGQIFPFLDPILGSSDPATLVGLGLLVMIIFHVFIISNFPLAVPLEWNLVHIFAGLFLFGVYHDVPVFANTNGLLMAAVFGMSVIIPAIGFIWPKYISFLVAMRYYAGNWPIGMWLIKPSAEEKIEKHVRKVSPNIQRQLAMLKIYPPEAAVASGIRILAFRSLHLLTRGVHMLLPKAVDDIDQYQWREGETQCAHILGWNFGDGHLHNEELIAALHKRCNFEEAELRVIWLESEPLFKGTTDYKIIDGKNGVIATGTLKIDDLEKELPWKEFPRKNSL